MASSRTPAPRASQPKSLCCTFCDKSKDAVAKLIAGPGVYICDECVGLWYEIITEDPMPGYDGSDWPRHDGLKWPHLGVVIGSGMGVSA